MAVKIEKYPSMDYVANWIGHRLTFWGRIPVEQCKEKYWTIRVYIGLRSFTFYDLIFPNSNGAHPLWLYDLQSKSFMIIFFDQLARILIPWQNFVYRWTYKRAIKKWPEYREAMLGTADWYYHLKGL